MKPCINFIRYALLLFIFISCMAALVVLGLDLDLLLNGPDYLSKIITNIVNRYFNANKRAGSISVFYEKLNKVLTLDLKCICFRNVPFGKSFSLPQDALRSTFVGFSAMLFRNLKCYLRQWRVGTEQVK